MKFKEPTYEEWKKSTNWAKFKYKYGIVVMILSWILFLFVIIYMISNIEQIKAKPLTYAMGKYDLKCICTTPDGGGIFIDHDSISSKSFNPDEYMEKLNLSEE